ncbi:MAG: glycosyltransferase family 2 protein [Chlorobiaceae bacterium]|nr:glycosyltransferase family 2 protein [Chlorobiaceae bacterium]
MPDVSVIIVNYNRFDLTHQAIGSLIRYSPEVEIIVVDNSSTPNSAGSLTKEFPSIKYIGLSKNEGFGYANNRGAKLARGEYIFLLNNDAFLMEDTPQILASFCEANPSVGICAPKLIYPNGNFQLSWGRDPSIINEWIMRRMYRKFDKSCHNYISKIEKQYNKITSVDWLTGAALMIRKDVYNKVGGFDEKYFMYYEDSDLCKRVRDIGYSILYVPTTIVAHIRNETMKSFTEKVSLEYRKSQILYYRKHKHLWSRFLLRIYLIFRSGGIKL